MISQDNQNMASQLSAEVQNTVHKDKATQDSLNKPLGLAQGMDQKDREFLNLLLGLVNEGKINLYNPDTLINHAFYDTLDFSSQGKADFEAVNMLSAIREIKGLCDAGYMETYQVANAVNRLRATKERLEIEGGDLFII